MRTLHIGLHVTDRERSLAFYTALGYEVVGRVPETPIGELTMLKLPDDPFVSIELVAASTPGDARTGGALSHLVIQVASLDEFLAELATRSLSPEAPTTPDPQHDIRTAWITDPDGNRIELVQWPTGHAEGMTVADFAAAQDEEPSPPDASDHPHE